jgi:hypothetical protein
MDDVQKHNICINLPLSQICVSYLQITNSNSDTNHKQIKLCALDTLMSFLNGKDKFNSSHKW